MVREFSGKDKGAIISECGKYRYVLYRKASRESEKSLCFICLNPSTADDVNDDQTVSCCERFACDWGCGDLYIVNLFAWRNREKSVLLQAPRDKVGPRNDHYIDKCVKRCDMTVAAWGAFVSSGKLLWRAEEVSARCDNLWALDIIKKGHPRHPSRAPGNLVPVEFPGYA